MTDIVSKLIKESMPKWENKDFQMALEVQKTISTPGWKFIEKLYDDQKTVIWNAMRKAKKEDIVWRLIGVMEGHQITCDIPLRVLQESEKQREYLKQEDLSSKENNNDESYA